MAIELCSENSGMGMSPRISFSHDLCQSDIVPVEQHPFRSNSSGSIDFDFCIRESFDQESSSADELFSDGKILPVEIKKKTTPSTLPPLPSPPPHSNRGGDHTISNENFKRDCTKENKITSNEADEKQNSKSFWRFKRSSSLNCGSGASGYGRSLCPLPLLSRSNSTGSAPNVKRAPLSKEGGHNHKQHLQKNSSVSSMKSSQSSSSMGYQKPPLSKSYGSYGNGVRVNPVLNVSSGNLFGLGSIFFNAKDKNKKK